MPPARVYNQLVEFERGTTNVDPGPRREMGRLRRRQDHHLPSAQGRQVPLATSDFKPTRDFNADDVLFSFNRQWKDDHPYHKVSGGAYDYFNDMGMPDLLKSIEKVDDYTVVFKLKEPNAPILANLAMDFATIQSAEYADQHDEGGHARAVRPGAGRHRPVPVRRLPEGCGHPLQGLPRILGRQGRRSTIWSLPSRPDADGPLRQAQGQRVPGDDRTRTRPTSPRCKANDKLNLLEQAGLNIGYLALNVTKPPFDKKEVRQAINMAIDKARSS